MVVCGITGTVMGELSFNVLVKDENGLRLVMLIKDQKPICRTWCGVPLELPPSLNVSQTISRCRVACLPKLTHFPVHPAYKDSYQRKEWGRFMNFLLMHNKIGLARFGKYEIYILPPDGSLISGHEEKSLAICTAKVAFRETESLGACSDAKENVGQIAPQLVSHQREMDGCTKGRLTSSTREAAVTIEEPVDASDASVKASRSVCGVHPSVSKSREVVAESKVDTVKDNFTERNYVRTDPSYLKTLGQSHSSWVFGAIAELVDNARDAEAKKLNISVETIFYKKAGGDIPVLSIKDDGHGMTHQEICRMVSFGHKQQDGDDPERIGRFGIGFKTGAMRLGKDALVLTQTAESRSIAFLSQSLNEGKDNLEIPIVSYRRQGQYMELDKEVQSEELAEYNLKAIKEFSPFNEYMIGEKAADFHDSKTGTQIYIWNLEKWGSDYCLEWQSGKRGGSSFYQGDIFIRSRRVRSRPGQTSRKVPLDCSLKAYMEVIFLDPRMKIHVQDSLVKSRPLAKSLGKTSVITGNIMGKAVQLTLGRCQLEWEQGNGGIFLYWHGRLIEAYKRVGTMLHNADTGRGVLGVIDVTSLMDDGSGCVYVHNNKQGFQDCEPYALLEEWLADRFHEYWDTKFEVLEVQKPDNGYEPDCQWVQCDKCRKWRILRSDFDCRRLPSEWFCFMEPFNGRCDIPEQKVGDGVITISAKRGRCDSSQAPMKNAEETHGKNGSPKPAGNSGDASSQTKEDEENSPAEEGEMKAPLKRLRRGGAKKKR
ncbi:MORC family CW-type zinc finger protein 4-like protein [Drosera capensis]